MESKYYEVDAKELIRHYADIAEELVLRTDTSRLLGANPNLVLHGGGNTSIKLIQKNILLEDQEILSRQGQRCRFGKHRAGRVRRIGPGISEEVSQTGKIGR